MLPTPRIRFSQAFASESSRSSMTPGAPELSIFTTSSASSAGPVIWFRWSTHHAGTSIDRKSVVEGKSGDLGGRRIIKKNKVLPLARRRVQADRRAATDRGASERGGL